VAQEQPRLQPPAPGRVGGTGGSAGTGQGWVGIRVLQQGKGLEDTEVLLSWANWMSDALTSPASWYSPWSTTLCQEPTAAAEFPALTNQTIMPFWDLLSTACSPDYISHLIVSLLPFFRPLASFLCPVLSRNQMVLSEHRYFH